MRFVLMIFASYSGFIVFFVIEVMDFWWSWSLEGCNFLKSQKGLKFTDNFLNLGNLTLQHHHTHCIHFTPNLESKGRLAVQAAVGTYVWRPPVLI